MTRRPKLSTAATLVFGLLLVGVAGPLAGAGAVDDEVTSQEETAQVETVQDETATDEAATDDAVSEVEEPTPAPSVLVCNLWDGEPFDYWAVRQLDRATGDWWVANSPNASIVSSAAACPGNDLVALCVSYNGGEKLITVTPSDANWHLSSNPTARLATNGLCAAVVDPTPQPTATPEPTLIPQPTATPRPDPTASPQPTTEPTTTPTPEVEGTAPTATATPQVLGVSQERDELALTGTNHVWLALTGTGLIASGAAMVALRRRSSVTNN